MRYIIHNVTYISMPTRKRALPLIPRSVAYPNDYWIVGDYVNPHYTPSQYMVSSNKVITLW